MVAPHCRILITAGTITSVDPARTAVVGSAACGGFVQGSWKGLGTQGTLGLEIALGVMLPSYVGSLLDERYGTGQTLIMVGFAIGLAHGARAVWRALQQANRAAEREQAEAEARRKKYYDDAT